MSHSAIAIQINDPENYVIGGKSPPERNVIRMAVIIAVVHNLASISSRLAFIWATVVLLGGFATTLEPMDFWSVTGILLVQGIHILSLRDMMEGHQTRSLEDDVLMAAISEDMKDNDQPQPHTTVTTIVPESVKTAFGSLFRAARSLLSAIQLYLAMSCAAVCCFRLTVQSFGSDVAVTKNGRSALVLFYSVALVEAVLFIGERAYWVWMVAVEDVSWAVCQELGLGRRGGAYVVKNLFFNAYGAALTGSILKTWKMEFFDFGLRLFTASGKKTRSSLGAAMILSHYMGKNERKDELLKLLCSNKEAINRLVDLMNLENLQCDHQQYISLSVGEILLAFFRDRRSVKIAINMEGCIRGILILMDHNKGTRLGLQILTEMARDDNKVPRIIDFIEGNDVQTLIDNTTASEFAGLIGMLGYPSRFSSQIIQVLKIKSDLPFRLWPPIPLIELSIQMAIRYGGPNIDNDVIEFLFVLFKYEEDDFIKEHFGEGRHLLLKNVDTALQKMAFDQNSEALLETGVILNKLLSAIDDRDLMIRSCRILSRIFKQKNSQLEGYPCDSDFYKVVGAKALKLLKGEDGLYQHGLIMLASAVLHGLGVVDAQSLLEEAKTDTGELLQMMIKLLCHYKDSFRRPDIRYAFVDFVKCLVEKERVGWGMAWNSRYEMQRALLDIETILHSTLESCSYFESFKSSLHAVIGYFSS